MNNVIHASMSRVRTYFAAKTMGSRAIHSISMKFTLMSLTQGSSKSEAYGNTDNVHTFSIPEERLAEHLTMCLTVAEVAMKRALDRASAASVSRRSALHVPLGVPHFLTSKAKKRGGDCS